MSKYIHINAIDRHTYFAVKKNKDRSLRVELKTRWLDHHKCYPYGTKFESIYQDIQDLFVPRGITLKEKYNQNNFKAALKRLENYQLKLFMEEPINL